MFKNICLMTSRLFSFYFTKLFWKYYHGYTSVLVVLKQKTEEEMDLLRIQTAQNAAIIDSHSYNGLVSQFSSQLAMNQVHHYLPPQLQVPQQPHLFMPMSMPPPPPPPQQPQLFMPPSPPQQPHIFMPLPSPSSPPSGHPFNGEFGPDFSNYNEELADNSNRKWFVIMDNHYK